MIKTFDRVIGHCLAALCVVLIAVALMMFGVLSGMGLLISLTVVLYGFAAVSLSRSEALGFALVGILGGLLTIMFMATEPRGSFGSAQDRLLIAALVGASSVYGIVRLAIPDKKAGDAEIEPGISSDPILVHLAGLHADGQLETEEYKRLWREREAALVGRPVAPSTDR